MADMKFSADLDLKVNTDAVAQDIARAIGQATSARAHAIDRAVAGLSERIGSDFIYENVRSELASVVGPGASIADFAAMAANSPYNYKPSNIQTIVRNEAAVAAAQYDGKVDLPYKMDAEAATGEIRRHQRQLRAAELAGVYLGQGNTLLDAASFAETPEAQRILLSRAASRYGSISSRTLMEAGGVSDKAAVAALTASATVSAMRSKVKTANQEEEESRRVAEELSNQYLGNFRYNSGLFRGIRRAEEAKKAQEESAWLAREKELAYNPSQKAREMEEGFRIIEASSATEDIYNAAKDPFAQQQSVRDSISAARSYLSSAANAEANSAERQVYLKLAASSLSGITPKHMSDIGFGSEEIVHLTTAVVELTDMIKLLSGGGNGGGNNPIISLASGYKFGRQVGAAIEAGVGIAMDIMGGRTKWLADTRSPYQTRREVRQEWAQKYGSQAIKLGAGIGGAIGTAILPGVGTLAGAAIGALPGSITALMGKHYSDEKQLGDAYQTRAIDMARYYNLYGEGVNYNYAQMAENTGYISKDSMLKLNQTADMLPGAMAFGAVGEQEMLALSMMPSYYASLMEGRSTIELAEAYRRDIMNLPKEYRQYITSILPGASEDLRAFVSSAQYGSAFMSSYATIGFDKQQRYYGRGLESARFGIAFSNVSDLNKNMASQVPLLDYPNYVGTPQEHMLAELNASVAGRLLSSQNVNTQMLEAINSVWTGDKAHSKLGDIIIQIDGEVIHQQPYTYNDFLTGSQSYVVGG